MVNIFHSVLLVFKKHRYSKESSDIIQLVKKTATQLGVEIASTIFLSFS